MSRYSPPEVLPQLCRLDKNISRNVASGQTQGTLTLEVNLTNNVPCVPPTSPVSPKKDIVRNRISRVKKGVREMLKKEHALSEFKGILII